MTLPSREARRSGKKVGANGDQRASGALATLRRCGPSAGRGETHRVFAPIECNRDGKIWIAAGWEHAMNVWRLLRGESAKGPRDLKGVVWPCWSLITLGDDKGSVESASVPSPPTPE